MSFIDNLFVRKSQHTEAKALKLFSPIYIILRLTVCKMIGSINFDYQHLLQAYKICNKVVDDMLTLKFYSKLTATQLLPQTLLRISLIIPVLTSKCLEQLVSIRTCRLKIA